MRRSVLLLRHLMDRESLSRISKEFVWLLHSFQLLSTDIHPFDLIEFMFVLPAFSSLVCEIVRTDDARRTYLDIFPNDERSNAGLDECVDMAFSTCCSSENRSIGSTKIDTIKTCCSQNCSVFALLFCQFWSNWGSRNGSRVCHQSRRR
jgi:hypothetical protein